MTVGMRIKELRLSQDLSLRDLGNLLGVTAATLQRYESGVITNIKPEMLKKIAEAFGTTVSWLVGEDPQKPRGTIEVELSAMELQLVTTYRNLPENEREAIKTLIEILKSHNKKAETA